MHSRGFKNLVLCKWIYRRVTLIRPPILYTTSSLKWGEGLYSNMQLVSNISPPPPPKKKSFTRSLHTLPKLRGLPTSEKSCQFNARSITFTTTVGHVPREISRVCWYFLHKSGSEMTCIVNGDSRRSEVDGKGLVVPCVYIFKGKQKHLERLIN